MIFFIALEIFRVPNNSTELQVRLTDNRNASIPEHKLTQILRQFHRSASFFIQMDFVDDLLNDFVPKIITPEVIFSINLLFVIFSKQINDKIFLNLLDD